MTALLLDTHAWIWLAVGDKRLAKHARLLQRAAESKELLLSTVSVYEAALIGIETDDGKRRGKQGIVMRPTVREWIRDAIVGTRVVTIPLDAEVAIDGASRTAMHGDPFDRLIVATTAATGAHSRASRSDP